MTDHGALRLRPTRRATASGRSHDYWEQAAGDLATYSTHAHRNTIEASDVACLFARCVLETTHPRARVGARTHLARPIAVGALLLQRHRRQRQTTNRTTLEDLARQLLPREYVEEIVPIARARNEIQPPEPIRP